MLTIGGSNEYMDIYRTMLLTFFLFDFLKKSKKKTNQTAKMIFFS